MREDRVLVIGAAHLDIVGDYGSYVNSGIDKPGELIFSVGGTAYNIAANLAQNGVPVTFATDLKENSLITPIILNRMKSYGIDTSLVRIVDTQEESGFIALREEGKLVSAVTASVMERFVLSDQATQEAIHKCRFIVIDCNVSSTILNKVQSIASKDGKKIFVAGVSEAKAKRILDVDPKSVNPFPFFCYSINDVEARSLGIPIENRTSYTDSMELCKRFGCENIIVTLGEQGHRVYSFAGDVLEFPAPVVSRIVSVTGAGDALLAAICHQFYYERDIDWVDANRVINRFAAQVLGRRGATVGARTAPKELNVIPHDVFNDYKSQQEEKIIEVIGSKTVKLFGARIPRNEIFAAIAFAFAITAAILEILR